MNSRDWTSHTDLCYVNLSLCSHNTSVNNKLNTQTHSKTCVRNTTSLKSSGYADDGWRSEISVLALSRQSFNWDPGCVCGKVCVNYSYIHNTFFTGRQRCILKIIRILLSGYMGISKRKTSSSYLGETKIHTHTLRNYFPISTLS